MQEFYDFYVTGYLVFPVSTIAEIRYNLYDKYFDKMIKWEKLIVKIEKKHNIDLTD